MPSGINGALAHLQAGNVSPTQCASDINLLEGSTLAHTSTTFPRVSAEGGAERIDMDAHFWAHRRLVFACVLAANLIVAVVVIVLALADPGFARLARSVSLWTGVAIFVIGTATAAFAPEIPAWPPA